MFSSKQLTEEQVATIKQWAANGSQLPDIQKQIREEMGLTLTFMDTRLLILDLGIELIVQKEADPSPTIATETELVATGSTTLSVDAVTLPGAIISGKVIFASGHKGFWALDQSGRPSLDLDDPEYRPTQEEIVDFQQQLRAIIEDAKNRGF